MAYCGSFTVVEARCAVVVEELEVEGLEVRWVVEVRLVEQVVVVVLHREVVVLLPLPAWGCRLLSRTVLRAITMYVARTLFARVQPRE